MDVVALLHSGWLLPVLALLVTLDGPFPVVPSEPLLMTAAAVAVGRHDMPVAAGLFGAALLGSVTGDMLMFALGRSSRRLREPGDSAVSRWVRRGVEHRPAVTIVGARFLPGGRLVSTVAAGRFGLPPAQFVTWSLVSSTAWSAYMMGVGLLLGPLTGGDPGRGLLAGLTMAGLTGGTFALIQRVHRTRRERSGGARFRTVEPLRNPAQLGVVVEDGGGRGRGPAQLGPRGASAGGGLDRAHPPVVRGSGARDRGRGPAQIGLHDASAGGGLDRAHPPVVPGERCAGRARGDRHGRLIPRRG